MDIITSVENFLDKFGLMTGPYAIPGRMVLGALLGGLIITWLRPSSMFINGVARPWSGYSNSEEATLITWWMVPMAFAFVLGVLI